MDIRILHEDKHASVVCSDKPGAGGACHRYQVVGVPCDAVEDGVFVRVKFQEGPITETGRWNGCQNEDLLRIVQDRLEGFQSGDFPCQENADALLAVRQALSALEKRTTDRESRNVEGRNQP